MRPHLATLLLILFALLAACQSSDDSADAPPTPLPPSADMAALAERITLPYEPESVVWQVQQQGVSGLGPTDFSLVAVLTYDEATMDQLRAQLETTEPLGAMRVEENFFKAWYPDSIRNSFTREAGSDEWVLQGSQYPPDLFAKQSLINGFFFITEEGRSIFLRLFTM